MASQDVFLADWHSHPFWEIVYYVSGTGTLLIGNESIDFKPNMIVCQPPNIPHKEYSQNGFRDIFYICEDFVNVWDDIPKFTDNSSCDFYKILMHMYLEFHKRQNNWSSIVYHLKEALYQYMISLNVSPYRSPAVGLLENIIIQNISNSSFKISEAIQNIDKSSGYLRKLFKKEVGLTPTQYLIEKRLNYAKMLISNSSISLPISTISALSGFDDPYYFSRLFKKRNNKSPTEWRKEFQL